MATEVEVKLDLHPAVVLPPLDGVIEGARVSSDTIELRATYFDTEDLRLIRAGITLRRRPEDGSRPWQVKLPLASGEPDALQRTEVDVDGGTRRPPAQARMLVRAVTRDAPLRPVARLVTRRKRTRVLIDDERVAEVADDDVTAYHGRRLLARFREVEVEARRRRYRRPLVAALQDAGAEVGDNTPKLVRVLGPAAAEPADVSAPAPITPDPQLPVVTVVARALQNDLSQMVHHHGATWLGEDDEALHQMRVATRRLRTTLRIYGDVLDSAWAASLRAELKDLAGALGEVRDLDVLIDRVRRDGRRLAPADAGAAERLQALLLQRRQDSRAALVSVLQSNTYPELLERLHDAAAAPACVQPDAPSGRALAPMVSQAWRAVATAQADGASLHDIRLVVKRLRYAADAVVPAFGDPARRLSRAAARAQDVLGVHQDATVAVQTYRSLLPDVDTEVAHVLGQFTARALRRQRRAEREWTDVWPRLRRRSRRRFLEEIPQDAELVDTPPPDDQ